MKFEYSSPPVLSPHHPWPHCAASLARGCGRRETADGLRQRGDSSSRLAVSARAAPSSSPRRFTNRSEASRARPRRTRRSAAISTGCETPHPPVVMYWNFTSETWSSSFWEGFEGDPWEARDSSVYFLHIAIYVEARWKKNKCWKVSHDDYTAA